MHGDKENGYPHNTSSCYENVRPKLNSIRPTLRPPPYEYVQEFPGAQAEVVSPTEVILSHTQSINNQKIMHEPLSMYNPGFVTPNIESTAAQMVLPQPTVFPSPASAMNDGMVPPSNCAENSSVPVYVNSVQPMVITTQSTVNSTGTRFYRDYLPWSIFNILFCCLIFGIVALKFSLQTRSAKSYGDWEEAKKKSRLALAFNLTSLVLGIASIAIVIAVYYTQYSSYINSYTYSYPSYDFYYHG